MDEIENYILSLKNPQQKIMQFLHDIISSQAQIRFKLRYKVPFYYCKSWFCYLNTVKNNGVELAFVRGKELSNNHELLDSKGRKQVAGITFNNIKDIEVDLVLETIQEAILLDETVSYNPIKSKNF